ncbi:DUF4825 domain-containing protein [Clostridium baratii]|uniref:DUF4825 domain-containing protein n=1 Tax=Clostridium baratii TaxID=1561 RepID=UPI000B08B035|nr:DUF4825 domain-containing protein [Clostridium baratii]
MRRNIIARATIVVSILVLLWSNLYFFNENTKPDNNILIGVPINGVNGARTEFSEPIKEKDDSNLIQLALMNAISIDKPKIADKLPDATIMINDRDVGVSYLSVDVWFDNEKAIFSLGGIDSSTSEARYKETVGDFGEGIINCISKYQNKDSKEAREAEKKVNDISDINMEELKKYKDSYVGDNSAVINILANLPLNTYVSELSLKTDRKPYEITVNYKESPALGLDDYNNFWKDKNPNEVLEKNAALMFSLIKNADVIEFNVENIGEKNYKYTRDELKEKYGEDFKVQ